MQDIIKAKKRIKRLTKYRWDNEKHLSMKDLDCILFYAKKYIELIELGIEHIKY